LTGADDPLRYFRIEARDIAEEMGRDVLRLEAAPAPDLVPRLLRLAHTLKGAARVVKQNEIAEQAHAVEEALMPLRDRPGATPKAEIDVLLRRVDGIAARVATLNGPKPSAAAPVPQAASEEPFERADMAELDALYDAIVEAGRQLRAVRGTLAASADLHGLDQAEREIAQALDAAAKLRLVPAAATIAALERTARDVAQSLGKEARFAAIGGGIRLEAPVLGAVRGALIQLVRNAVAHGIEAPAERERRGKLVAGNVTLNIARRGNRVAFICDDDGGGIDLDAVRRVARERGAAASDVERLDAQGLVQLLLKGGLSTAANANELAGRGIGLDVVREAASRLRGEIEVETDSGKGTRVALIVPVSLSTVEALLMEAGGIVAALPVSAVQDTLRTSPAEGDTILHAGEAIPLTPLDGLLARLPGAKRRAAPRVAVVVAAGAARAAIAVDRLLGVVTLVVQPLPDTVRADAMVAGAALDADGVPRLVLDPDGLVAAARAAPPAETAAAADPKAPILVVDDSLTTRMLEQSILESAGFEVDLAVSAEDALAKAARRRYGLFLVDVEMPGMDGFTFVAQTRADANFRGTPALLVSSRNGDEDRRRASEAGAAGYIVKGEFDQTRFLDTVRRLAG
jgi:two-component system, chemotaxis family, sensor kinase CheA